MAGLSKEKGMPRKLRISFAGYCFDYYEEIYDGKVDKKKNGYYYIF